MKQYSLEDIPKIIEDLQAGLTLVFPTETTYGLGCDATNQAAVDKIFQLKGRPNTKSLLIVVPTVADAQKYILTNFVFKELSAKYWPGPLTIVGEYKNDPPALPLAEGVVSEQGTVAVRVTSFPFLKEVTTKFGRPLVATSANLAGAGELYDPRDIEKIFAEQSARPDALVDGGTLPTEPPTTIVSVVGGKLEIVRQGVLDIKELSF